MLVAKSTLRCSTSTEPKLNTCIKEELRKSECFFPSEVDASHLTFVIMIEFKSSNLLSCLNLRRIKTYRFLTDFLCKGTNTSVRDSRLLLITTVVDSICQNTLESNVIVLCAITELLVLEKDKLSVH